MHDLRTEKGFTLVEVLTAMFILSIGMLGVGTMIIESIKADSYNARVREAEHLAVAKLEQLRGQSADNKLTAGIQNFYPYRNGTESASAEPGQIYIRDCNIVAADANNICRVDVVVAWPTSTILSDADSQCVPGKANTNKCKHKYRLTGYILQK